MSAFFLALSCPGQIPRENNPTKMSTNGFMDSEVNSESKRSEDLIHEAYDKEISGYRGTHVHINTSCYGVIHTTLPVGCQTVTNTT
jgi:hypothetical protein